MVKLKAQLICLVVVFASCKVYCDHSPDPALSDECGRMCNESTVPMKDSQQSASCLEQCLLQSKVKVNSTTRVRPPTPTVTITSATEAWKHGCPRHYGPGPSEDIPGEVTGLTVTFEQGTKEDRQGWVAGFSWTAPKLISDANSSLNWRGYLVVWISQSEASKGEPQPVTCKLLPKNQTHFNLSETDGWKYPDTIYTAVIALPTKRDAFELYDFDPRAKDLGTPLKFGPVPINFKGRKRFKLQSPEGIAIFIMAGLITGFAIVWAVNICIVKRKSFTGFDVRLPSTGEKKAGKEADDQKDQLIV